VAVGVAVTVRVGVSVFVGVADGSVLVAVGVLLGVKEAVKADVCEIIPPGNCRVVVTSDPGLGIAGGGSSELPLIKLQPEIMSIPQIMSTSQSDSTGRMRFTQSLRGCLFGELNTKFASKYVSQSITALEDNEHLLVNTISIESCWLATTAYCFVVVH
jgi:hypothetical protein